MAQRSCFVCHQDMEDDDIDVRTAHGGICLRCMKRETGDQKPVPRPLEREMQATLKELPGWI